MQVVPIYVQHAVVFKDNKEKRKREAPGLYFLPFWLLFVGCWGLVVMSGC